MAKISGYLFILTKNKIKIGLSDILLNVNYILIL